MFECWKYSDFSSDAFFSFQTNIFMLIWINWFSYAMPLCTTPGLFWWRAYSYFIRENGMFQHNQSFHCQWGTQKLLHPSSLWWTRQFQSICWPSQIKTSVERMLMGESVWGVRRRPSVLTRPCNPLKKPLFKELVPLIRWDSYKAAGRQAGKQQHTKFLSLPHPNPGL